MLQILGWLACVMLAVKLMELSHSPHLRNEDGLFKPSALAVLCVGWVSIPLFVYLIEVQAAAVNSRMLPVP